MAGDPAHLAGHRGPVGLDELGLDPRPWRRPCGRGARRPPSRAPARGASGPTRGSPRGRPRARRVRRAGATPPTPCRAAARRRSGRRPCVRCRRRSRCGGRARAPGAHHEPHAARHLGVDVTRVARQWIERTSSPRTYSRMESNSVPCPRISSGVRPSSSRRRVSRDGRWAREWKGGSTRTRPGAASVAWRDHSPSGPRADRDLLGPSIAAAPRGELQRHPAPLARRDPQPGPVWAGHAG